MERLTERVYDGLIIIKQDSGDEGNYKAADKLATYEDLEEQGLLMKLLCKVGDSVFIIVGKDVSKQKIIKVEISDNGIIFKTNRQKRIFSIAGLGENVFLTLEEAEKKLEEMQNAKNA